MSEQGKVISIEDQARKMSEMKRKELEVRNEKIEKDYRFLEDSKRRQEDLKKLDFFNPSKVFLDNLQRSSKNQFDNAKKKLRILTEVPELSDAIPFYAEEMVLLAASTGTGKTTACVNITHSLMMQGKRPIVITNEESATSFINKLSALFINKRFAKIDKMDEATKNRFVELVPKIASRIGVVDADYAINNGLSIPNLTNTIEGLETMVDKLIEEAKVSGNIYDAVIIDYYQKFNSSSRDPRLDPYECQNVAANLIERLRINYPAPIVVLAQIDKASKEGLPFEKRIQGRKIICNFATVNIEMIVDKKSSTTKFDFHKGRNLDFPDGDIVCGWRAGKYVKYDKAFVDEVNARKLQNIERGMFNGKTTDERAEGAVAGDSGSEQSLAEDEKTSPEGS